MEESKTMLPSVFYLVAYEQYLSYLQHQILIVALECYLLEAQIKFKISLM